jgi:hypothetical protein
LLAGTTLGAPFGPQTTSTVEGEVESEAAEALLAKPIPTREAPTNAELKRIDKVFIILWKPLYKYLLFHHQLQK